MLAMRLKCKLNIRKTTQDELLKGHPKYDTGQWHFHLYTYLGIHILKAASTMQSENQLHAMSLVSAIKLKTGEIATKREGKFVLEK